MFKAEFYEEFCLCVCIRISNQVFAVQSSDGCLLYKFEPACRLGIKLAGVHWWFKSRAHAAELTAGYYNTRERDGYGAVLDILERYQARLSFTCVEMRDCEHPNEARCSPQGRRLQIAGFYSLLRQLQFSRQLVLVHKSLGPVCSAAA